jgi:hypothetical protein
VREDYWKILRFYGFYDLIRKLSLKNAGEVLFQTIRMVKVELFQLGVINDEEKPAD